MPIENLSNLESSFVKLFEENGYVESYRKNVFHKLSPYHIYFLKDLYCKTNEDIQCGIKYSKVYNYIEFTIYVSFNCVHEQRLIKRICFDDDRFDVMFISTENNLQSNFSDIVMHEIEKSLSKSERMCDFLNLAFEAGYWILDMSEECKIYTYCGSCGRETLKIIDFQSIKIFNQANPDIFEEYLINDSSDFDKIDLSRHICGK